MRARTNTCPAKLSNYFNFWDLVSGISISHGTPPGFPEPLAALDVHSIGVGSDLRIYRERGFSQKAGLGVACSLLALGVVFSTAQTGKKKVAQKPVPSTYEKNAKPFIDKYCGSCHYSKDPSGGISLAGIKTTEQLLKVRNTWERVGKAISTKHMPPDGMPQPSEAQRQNIVSWIEQTISADCKLPDPGRVTLRRLNREEYNNTVRDLLGVKIRPADDFPSDDVGNGFDNIGDVLSVSPLLVEKYMSAAELVSEAAIEVPVNFKQKVEGENFKADHGGEGSGNEFLLNTEGTATAEFNVPKPGKYKVRIQAYGQQAGPDPVKVKVAHESEVLGTYDLKQVKRDPWTQDYEVRMAGAKNHISISFLNDFYDAKLPKGKQDRNLVIQSVIVTGPIDGQGDHSASYRKVIPFDPTPDKREASAKQFLRAFATRAFRRPATEEDVERLMRVYKLGEKTPLPFERGMQLAIQAALVSPHFLYRIETDSTGIRPLTGYEVASRLSYFLWSSMPDDQLFDLAKKGKLSDNKVLTAQVQRMIMDPRSSALTDNFAGQWLQLRTLPNHSPDPQKFPNYSEGLRDAMIQETKQFFTSVLRENRSVIDFLDGKYTYVNEVLAKHYGIQGVTGPEFRKVALSDPNRGGILTQASILTLTSNPTRTSPVKRGKWVMEQILGTPPPPPPPGVPDLKEGNSTDLVASTVRQRLEEHRKNPMCASCHKRMDPIGFGLENFDPVGGWRAKDGTAPIDASGTLPGNITFNGPQGLRKYLLGSKQQFVHTLAEKMLTYAIGRGVDSRDKCSVDDIVKATTQDGFKFGSMVKAIALSDPFRKRTGEGKKK